MSLGGGDEEEGECLSPSCLPGSLGCVWSQWPLRIPCLRSVISRMSHPATRFSATAHSSTPCSITLVRWSGRWLSDQRVGCTWGGVPSSGSQAELSGALKEGWGTVTTTNNSKTLMEIEHFPVIVSLYDKNIKFLCLCLELKQFNVAVIMPFWRWQKSFKTGLLGKIKTKEIFGEERLEIIASVILKLYAHEMLELLDWGFPPLNGVLGELFPLCRKR